MASLLSHKSIVEICTFVPSDEYARLPNREWRFIARNYVFLDDCDMPPPPGYFSSVGLRIAVGKHSLAETLDIVFSQGEPLLLWKTVPKGLIKGILERYRTECKESVAMRSVVITGKNVTNVWINAYYTSFPCRQCSNRGNAVDEHVVVFHLTPPCAVHQCLSLKYTRYKRVEVVGCRADCASISMPTQRLQPQRSMLRLADLRHEAFRFLPRTDLDTCLLVNSLWSGDVDDLRDKLALRPLKTVQITYVRYPSQKCWRQLQLVAISRRFPHFSALRRIQLSGTTLRHKSIGR